MILNIFYTWNYQYHFNHFFNDVFIFRTDCIKNLDVMLDGKLHLCYINYVHSQGLRTLGLIRYISHNFSSLVSLVSFLYKASVGS
jgi:hypothetical protein